MMLKVLFVILASQFGIANFYLLLQKRKKINEKHSFLLFFLFALYLNKERNARKKLHLMATDTMNFYFISDLRCLNEYTHTLAWIYTFKKIFKENEIFCCFFHIDYKMYLLTLCYVVNTFYFYHMISTIFKKDLVSLSWSCHSILFTACKERIFLSYSCS